LAPAYADTGNGLIVPMYGWDAGWSDIIHAKKENPGTKITVIVNPSSGPGSRDSHWASVVNDLQDAGILVVGYIATSYAGRSIDSIKDDIDKYYDWYGVNGIFLDEVSPSDASYYKSLRHYAEKPTGTQDVILNPGAPVPLSYANAGDVIIVYENAGLPSDVTSNGISESKLGVLSHGGNPSKSDFQSASNDVNYVYAAPDWMNVASNVDDQANWAN
ncbi:MAG TPA: spherulation-specific family 4 protein, partial [Nitrososphaera sp.]|nr:spherulation-specific family 4 protein [Nitrososphaera sp.]